MHMYYSCSFIDVIKSGSHIAPLKVCDGKLEISVYFNLTLWLSKSHADKLRYKFLNFCNLGLFKFLFSLLFWGTQRYLHCPDALTPPHTLKSKNANRRKKIQCIWPMTQEKIFDRESSLFSADFDVRLYVFVWVNERLCKVCWEWKVL